METKIYFSKDINDNVLDNYIIEVYDSGITCLLFNTKHRWIDFHRSTNDTYHFAIGSSWEGCKDEDNTYILEIVGEASDYLNDISKNIVTQVQEKDQISFYFIPFELITNNEKIKELSVKQRFTNKIQKCTIVYLDGKTIKDRYNDVEIENFDLNNMNPNNYEIVETSSDENGDYKIMWLETNK